MKNIDELIQNYWAGTLSAAEKGALLELLEEKMTDFSDEEYQAFTVLANEKQTQQNKNNFELNKLLQNIEHKLAFDKVKPQVLYIKPFIRWKWVAAASVLVLLSSTIWYVITQQSYLKHSASQLEPSEITFNNNSDKVTDTIMPDGSIIRLYPKSAIHFTDGFIEKERSIHLMGKAMFKVATDTSRPFIVYAGGFSTRALGTQFVINTNANGKFSVKLFEGKVVIKASEAKKKPFVDVYLTPGEEMVYDIQKQRIVTETTNEVVLKNENLKPQQTVSEPSTSKPVLAFNKLPLQVVFKQLEEEFSIMIIYDTDKLTDKLYSGSFDKSNSPFVILNLICKEYGWKVRIENGAYVISE